MNILKGILIFGALLGLTGCVDRRSPQDPLRSLIYTSPEAGDFRLVQNPELSTADRLVLELVGPAALQGHGVALFLEVDLAELRFAAVNADALSKVQNGNVFELGAAPQILVAHSAEGGRQLQVVACEKGRAKPKVLGGVLFRVAIALNPDCQLPGGSVLKLTAPEGMAKILLESESDAEIKTAYVKVGKVELKEAIL